MTTTTDPTALLAEALTGDGVYDLLGPFVYGDGDVLREDVAAAILAASPDLRRALSIGTAWLAAEEALPEGWSVFGVRMFSTGTERLRYRATAYSDDHHAGRCDGYGPTPEAALLALADALRKERGA